jgi:hypothetical protein
MWPVRETTLSNVRGRPQLGGWGCTATVLRFQMLLLRKFSIFGNFLRQSFADTTNLQLCLSPTAAQPQAPNIGRFLPRVQIGVLRPPPPSRRQRLHSTSEHPNGTNLAHHGALAGIKFVGATRLVYRPARPALPSSPSKFRSGSGNPATNGCACRSSKDSQNRKLFGALEWIMTFLSCLRGRQTRIFVLHFDKFLKSQESVHFFRRFALILLS